MIDEIKIKEYCEEYKDEIVNLILNIQQNEFNIPIKKEDQPDLSNVSKFYQKGIGNFWIALYNNQVVGTISLLDIGNNQGALRKMFVKAEYRGSGYSIARKLLNQLIYWCTDNKIEEIYLGTTDRFIAAHKFYEKNGFMKISKNDLPGTLPIMIVDTIFYKYNVQTYER